VAKTFRKAERWGTAQLSRQNVAKEPYLDVPSVFGRRCLGVCGAPAALSHPPAVGKLLGPGSARAALASLWAVGKPAANAAEGF